VKLVPRHPTTLHRIAMRGMACGVFACSLLALVSSKMDAAELAAALHHRPPTFDQASVQCAILLGSGVLAFSLNMASLLELNRQEGRGRLLLGVATTVGSFLVGFLVVGMLLPSRTV